MAAPFWSFQFVMSVARLSFSSGKSPQVKDAMTGGWQRFENIKKPRGKELRTDCLLLLILHKEGWRDGSVEHFLAVQAW